MEIISLSAIIHPRFKNIISEHRDMLWQARDFVSGPVHLIIPEILSENATAFKDALNKTGVVNSLYFAHKPVRSIAFLKQARYAGINIDVASENELCSALKAGFNGKFIECTGSKSDSFVLLAVLHGCLISVDSFDELLSIERACSLTKERSRVLLRVSELDVRDRALRKKQSRFGLPLSEIESSLLYIKKSQYLTLEGFHHHNDERQSDIKAGYVDELLSFMEKSYSLGLVPRMINIGGGWRSAVFEDRAAWYRFVERSEELVKKNLPTEGWRSHAFGLSLNEKSVVAGRERLQAKFSQPEFAQVLDDMFADERLRGRRLGDIIAENDFTIMVEPGWAMVRNAGISLLTINRVKPLGQNEFILVVNANMYNLGVQMSELWADPILLSKKEESGSQIGCFVAGNLCREEDMIYKRKVYFSRVPEPGDILVIPNTAAYNSSFEDAAPHQHHTGITFVIDDRCKQPILISDEAYNPWKGV